MKSNLEFKIKVQIIKKLHDHSLAKKMLEEHLSVQQAIDCSDAVMTRLYETANHLFDRKHYADAADAFLFLIGLNPGRAGYWIGLGMATQMNHHFDDAIDYYEIAALCDPEYPLPYLCLGKCLFALHERENALAAFQLAIEYAGERPEFHELKRSASKARDLLLCDLKKRV